MKGYWQFIKESKEEEIHQLCKKYEIENYTIRPDGKVDVDGDVHLQSKGLFGKLPIRFGTVTGFFYCYDNNLKTLEGCPEEVGEDFECCKNELLTLEGCRS